MIQLTTTKKLRISGQRPLGDEKWSRFQKEYPTSANCDINNISAKFENSILYVKQPKLITPDKEEDQANPNIVASKSQNPTDQPQPPKNVQQQSNQEAKSTKSVPEKPIEKKEPNDTKSVSENASERGKAREEEKSRDFQKGKSAGKTSEKHEKGNSSTAEGGESKQENASKREKAQEEKSRDFPSEGKSTGKTSEKHEKGNSSTVEGGESKQENASKRKKAQEKEKIRDFPSSEEGKSMGTSEKHEKMDGGNQSCETKQEDHKQGAGDLATKMKTSTRKLMSLVVIVLIAIGLGIHVKNWIRSGKKDEN